MSNILEFADSQIDDPAIWIRKWKNIRETRNDLVGALAQLLNARNDCMRESSWWSRLTQRALEAETDYSRADPHWVAASLSTIEILIRLAKSLAGKDLTLSSSDISSQATDDRLITHCDLRIAAHSLCYPDTSEQSTVIPVALVSTKQTSGQGIVAKLKLELLKTSSVSEDHLSCCAHHPAQSLTRRVGGSFRASMKNAWESALYLAHQDARPRGGILKPKSLMGRWSVEELSSQHGLPPELSFEETSISATAAWGWWHLLCKLQADPRILIIGEASSDQGALGDVDKEGVVSKVSKVYSMLANWTQEVPNAPPIDHIVVIGEENAAAAQDVVSKPSLLISTGPPSLKELVHLRSGYADELLTFLKLLRDACFSFIPNRPSWLQPENLSDFFLDRDIVHQDQKLPWSEVWQAHVNNSLCKEPDAPHKVALSGEVGIGRSVLLQHSIAIAANELVSRLEEKSITPDEVPVFFVRSDLTTPKNPLARDLETLRFALNRNEQLPEQTKNRIRSAGYVIAIDDFTKEDVWMLERGVIEGSMRMTIIAVEDPSSLLPGFTTYKIGRFDAESRPRKSIGHPSDQTVIPARLPDRSTYTGLQFASLHFGTFPWKRTSNPDEWLSRWKSLDEENRTKILIYLLKDRNASSLELAKALRESDCQQKAMLTEVSPPQITSPRDAEACQLICSFVWGLNKQISLKPCGTPIHFHLIPPGFTSDPIPTHNEAPFYLAETVLDSAQWGQNKPDSIRPREIEGWLKLVNPELDGWSLEFPSKKQWEFACFAGLDSSSIDSTFGLRELMHVTWQVCEPIANGEQYLCKGGSAKELHRKPNPEMHLYRHTPNPLTGFRPLARRA